MGLLGIPAMSEVISRQYSINVAPITKGEQNTHNQIAIERNYFSKAAKDIIPDSTYSKSGLINAPTAEAKAGYHVNTIV